MNRGFKDRNVRKLLKIGSSVGLTLPVEFLSKLRWKDHHKVTIHAKGRSLIIRDWHKHK